MATSWHTMAVISCPVLFTHFTEFLLSINTLVLGGRIWILSTTSSRQLDCPSMSPGSGLSWKPQTLRSHVLPGFACVGWGLTQVKWAWDTCSHLLCPSIAPFSCKMPPLQLSVGFALGEWRGEQTVGGVTASAAQAELHSSWQYLQLLSTRMKTNVLARSWRRQDLAALC